MYHPGIYRETDNIHNIILPGVILWRMHFDLGWAVSFSAANEEEEFGSGVTPDLCQPKYNQNTCIRFNGIE